MNPTSHFAPVVEFIVRESSAPNKGSWRWRHRRVNVAVLEVLPGARPAMISERARGVRAIVAYEGGLFDGRSLRCQASLARARAEALAFRLNREAARACWGEAGASCA